MKIYPSPCPAWLVNPDRSGPQPDRCAGFRTFARAPGRSQTLPVPDHAFASESSRRYPSARSALATPSILVECRRSVRRYTSRRLTPNRRASSAGRTPDSTIALSSKTLAAADGGTSPSTSSRLAALVSASGMSRKNRALACGLKSSTIACRHGSEIETKRTRNGRRRCPPRKSAGITRKIRGASGRARP